MSQLKVFVARHPVPTYFALTFAISWGGLLAVGGLSGMSSTTWQADPRLPFFVVAMLAGPSIAGLLLTALVSGRAGFRELLSRLLRCRVDARWYAVALLTAPVVFITVHFALSLASPVFRPSVFTTRDTASVLLSAIAGALAVGVFEELGWTGFAIPTLRARYTALATALFVGVPWGAWHLLTNDVWIAKTYAGGLPLVLFVTLNGLSLVVGQLPAYRVLMVWVYDRTGSLLVAMLMHASLSACTFILGPSTLTGLGLVAYGFALAGAWWIIVAVFGLSLRYRRDLNAARARLAAVKRHVISTRWGAVEYAERGYGDPVLVVHGIFHNCVGGLLSVRDLFRDRRVIAPSRFGYLGSSMPPNATPAAQADAFAALLDALDVDQIDVIGLSAGTTSALQLALRHPEKVKHLAVLVGNLPGSPTAVVQPSWAKRVNRQPIMWALRTFAPSTMARLVAAVPKGFVMTSEDARFVTEFIDSLFPVSPEGLSFDLYVSNTDVNDYNLEALTVPTVIVHTKDDQLASHEASQRAAERIPGARFVSLESGGHLMLGQTEIIRNELADFFAESRERRAERVAS